MAKKFKYRLHDQIALLPKNVSMTDLENVLEKFDITPEVFYFDRNLSARSERSITAERLLIYARVLDCMPEDLLTETVRQEDVIELQDLKNLYGTPESLVFVS